VEIGDDGVTIRSYGLARPIVRREARYREIGQARAVQVRNTSGPLRGPGGSVVFWPPRRAEIADLLEPRAVPVSRRVTTISPRDFPETQPLSAGHRPRESLLSRLADILNDMDSRASDKIPGARVRVTRYVSGQSSGGRPREWLALADGAVQEARTEGTALALVGEPVPYQPGRAERRSGVPAEVITADHVPNSCTCSWAYSKGKLTLKHYNAACPVHLARLGA
jgi:hypothetical protein